VATSHRFDPQVRRRIAGRRRMHDRICINGMSTREWGVHQDLGLFGELGAHSMTLPVAKLVGADEATLDMVASSPVRPVLLGGGTATPFMAGLDVIGFAIDAAKRIGCPIFYSISGVAPARMSTDEAYDDLVQALVPISAYAREQGVRLAIENNSVATRTHGFVHTLTDSLALARDADLLICLELQNCWYERQLPSLFRQSADVLAMVQVSDFKVGEELRFNRCVPGDGDMPLEWLIGELLEAGYTGLFDIEVLGPHVEAEGYRSAIVRSIDWLTERFERWGV
jgi:sugar phosphate isomerase/epimerase